MAHASQNIILFTHGFCKYGRATDKIAICCFYAFYLLASEHEVILSYYIRVANNLKLTWRYGIAQEFTAFQQILFIVWKGPHGIETFETQQNIVNDIFIHYDDDTIGYVYITL